MNRRALAAHAGAHSRLPWWDATPSRRRFDGSRDRVLDSLAAFNPGFSAAC